MLRMDNRLPPAGGGNVEILPLAFPHADVPISRRNPSALIHAPHHREPSMSRRGNGWDNAVAESFVSSLKKARIKKRIDTTRELATAEIDDYIETFYNRTRRHSHLSGVSPETFEAVSNRA